MTALGLPVEGLVSARREHAQEAAARWRVRAYADLGEMLADPNVRSIHVCVPPSFHRSIVEAALAAGRAILCEKPLASSASDARKMVGAVPHTQFTRVAFNRRFDGGVQNLRGLVMSGELGEPVCIRGWYEQQWNAEPSTFDWRFDPAAVGRTRVVGDLGAHWLDLASHVLGVPLRRVSAVLVKPRGEREFLISPGGSTQWLVPTNEDAFAALLEYESGAHGFVHCTQLAHGSWDEIRIRVDGTRQSAWWESRHPEQVTVAHKLSGIRTLGTDSPSRSFERMVEEFYGSQHTEIGASFEDGWRNCAAIDAVTDSGLTGGGWIDVVPFNAIAGGR